MENLYQSELRYLRESARLFSNLDPNLEKFLGESSTDADVEKLLECFAFLTSKIRGKLDDQMDDFTTSVMSIVCPFLIKPIPSLTLIKFSPVDRAISGRQTIKMNSIVRTNTINGKIGQYATTHDIDIYPLEIENMQLFRTGAKSTINLTFVSLSNQALATIGLQNIRLTLTGDIRTRKELFLWIGRYLESAYLRFADGTKIALRYDQIKPIGLADDEALLPVKNVSFAPHRLLHEYFAYPEKFLGYDIVNLNAEFRNKFDEKFEIVFEFNRPFTTNYNVDTNNFGLYIVPAINLAPYHSNSINIESNKYDYEITPTEGGSDDLDVYSITALKSTHENKDNKNLGGFYSYRDFASLPNYGSFEEQLYFKARYERDSLLKCGRSTISFCKKNGGNIIPDDRALVADLLCFNKTLPGKLQIGDICKSTDSLPSFVTYRNITKPTMPLYPPNTNGFNWGLVSNLSSNYHDLQHLESIIPIIKKYNFEIVNNRQAERELDGRLSGIEEINTVPVDRFHKGRAFRGVKTTIRVNEQKFESLGELFLFGSILAQYFRVYASVNSFHCLKFDFACAKDDFTWPIQVGTQPLI